MLWLNGSQTVCLLVLSFPDNAFGTPTDVKKELLRSQEF